MKAQLVFLALVGLTTCLDFTPILDLCANPQPATKELPQKKLALPANYKISGSVTNLFIMQTWLLKETATKDFRAVERQTSNYQETWIQDLTPGAHPLMFVNSSTGACDGNATKPELFGSFKNIVGADTSSLNSIVNGLLSYVSTVKGFVLENHVSLVGGVNPNTWVTCINGNESKYLLEVRYGGDDTIAPALTAFSNPLLLSFRIAELATFNATVSKNHWSIELDRYENPVGDEAFIPHGVYCNHVEPAPLRLKDSDEFAATLSYFDYKTNLSEVVEVLYSRSRQVFIVAGNSFNRIMKYKDGSYMNGTDYVLHDFKYGYEVIMSHGACKEFKPLNPSTADVNVTKVGDRTILAMFPLHQILVDQSSNWVHYQNDVDMAGNTFTAYRSFDVTGDTIRELHLTNDNEIHSMNEYSSETSKLLRSMTVTKVPMESSRLNLRDSQMSNCYDSGHYPNNTWIVPIKEKNLTDLSRVGLSRLNEAVAASITKNVHAVIPYRVVVFYAENHNEGLSMILRLAEKTTVVPSNTTTYDYSTELSTFELFKLVEASLLAEKMPIEVETVDGQKEEWIADAKSLKMFSPDNDNGFVGYTGGAMFVLAIFCLLIGVSIGTVGVFVVTRRQRISTLAYQVFE